MTISYAGAVAIMIGFSLVYIPLVAFVMWLVGNLVLFIVRKFVTDKLPPNKSMLSIFYKIIAILLFSVFPIAIVALIGYIRVAFWVFKFFG